jgi:predicted DNA-binding protein (MmcQ/YjbR family)
VTNMSRLERIVAELPEAERVDIAEWGYHPSFRVRGKNFVFSDAEAQHLSVKLPLEEAAAAVATDFATAPAGYGLARRGWIDVFVPPTDRRERWQEIREWVRTSYTLVAPRPLARIVLEQERMR